VVIKSWLVLANRLMERFSESNALAFGDKHECGIRLCDRHLTATCKACGEHSRHVLNEVLKFLNVTQRFLNCDLESSA
jgi:hypothetical protein